MIKIHLKKLKSLCFNLVITTGEIGVVTREGHMEGVFCCAGIYFYFLNWVVIIHVFTL